MKKSLMFRQKINFILHVFLEIWEWYYKLVILSTFDMPDYAHPKWYYQLVGNFVRYFTWKLEFVSNILWIIVATHTQSDTMNLWKMFVFICWQKSTSSPKFFWRYFKDMQTSYFGYWPRKPKMKSICRKLRCLSAYQK